MDERIIDARGLSCPQPVILTINAMKKLGSGELTILVDTDTAKGNVSRAAKAQGWEVKNIQSEGDAYRVILIKA
ncbi:carbohydrate ABC transporter membrane protein 2, CUT1 family (plasmid) [Peptoclostridium acidaminophilum DSM 3953]|uniref:Carbohydrate ABC transporter membrane protein 2, CUT1 family n=1 Tax=Peptoclostridium acidaminophilum DSM 3953 TaxID=1286171 RepID=W8TAG6_PEPAC|nr:sulfurtransferase TusA family protein [Peptoclostridium acidaminophilum]AHM57895.1 carbohydrate ABC transporter membrane protein 2, CUT1 family [Peptoclostridium acidaminophilum DSM 3953]